MSKAAGAAAVQQLGLFPVKITTFKVEIAHNSKAERRYSEDEKLNLRRNLVHSSNISSRKPIPAEVSPEREVRTVQRSRFSQFVEMEISKMQEDTSQLQGFTPIIRQKIKQLRGLMQEKVEFLANHKKNNYSFSEYKIKSGDEGNRLSLHSRKQTDSPFAKSIRAKKLLKHPLKAEVKQEVEIPLPSRKMVLFGGSIDLRKHLSENPQDRVNLRDKLLQREWRKENSRLSHRYYLNRGQQNLTRNMAEELDDDCKPWQIHKHEQLQHFGHLNYL